MDVRTGNSEVLRALRTIFELGYRDIPAHPSMLTEVLGLRGARLEATLIALRHMGLLQRDQLRLTLPGLAVAAGLPPVLDLEQDCAVNAA